MHPDRYAQLMKLFDRACDMSGDDQRVLVTEVGAMDADLGERLAKLLHHDSHETDVLTRAAGPEVLAVELLDEVQPPPPPADASARIGARIGDWVVGERLGSGGLGTVHAARHVHSGMLVAIKFLRAHATADPDNVRRLEREFRAIARLDHPGCVRVFEHGHSAVGHFLVLEHVGGGDLTRLVGSPEHMRLRVVRDVALALAHIHEQGIVHRDLKPANVLLTEDNLPKLADFGVAKVSDASAIITDPRAVIGSIDYMSPEQLRGRADARSDIYALGCIIHELWCGEPPFTGDNFERLYARLKGSAPSLGARDAGAPATLVALTDSMLSRNPDERPDTTTLADALDSILRQAW